MRNKRLDGAFPIVAAMLGRKLGVNVRVGGDTAYTDGSSITLPAYSANDPYYLDIAWGYLAHEAAHIRFSEFVALTSPIRKKLVNILEDIRIERLIIKRYPGTFYTIQRLDEHLYPSPVGRSEGPAHVLTGCMMHKLAHDVHGFKGLRYVAQQAQELLEETFPPGVVAKLMGFMSSVPGLASTQDCIRLADAILAMLEDEKQSLASGQDKGGPDSQTASGGAQKDGGASQGPQDGKPGDPGQDKGGPDSQTVPGDTQKDDGASQGPQDGKPGDPGQDKGGPGAMAFAEAIRAVLEASEGQLPADPSETVRAILSGQQASDYDADIKIPLALEAPRDDVAGKALLARVSGQTARLRLTLQSIVQSHHQVGRSLKRTGNKPDGKRLYRIGAGDTKVFSHKVSAHFPKTDVGLLIDGSVSMSQGSRIIVATEAAFALALALESIDGVGLSVAKFPHDRTVDVIRLLARGQKARANAAAFLPTANGKSTPLCEALWYMASTILDGEGNRKIVFVLFDGAPDNPDATRAAIRRCEEAGVEFVGIGIGLDVSDYFSNNIVISNLEQMTPELFKVGQKLLLSA